MDPAGSSDSLHAAILLPNNSERGMYCCRGREGGKKIGVFGMVVIGFFWVHGGIYGNEAMLMAGPPLYVFILLGIVPFVYSLPIALIVAELSTAFPEDGGYVVWVQEACGRSIGSHHAYWVWVIYVVDAAIYPVLVANYVDTMVPMGTTSRGMLAVAIILGVTAINLAGTDVMVKFSTMLAIISLAPTLVSARQLTVTSAWQRHMAMAASGSAHTAGPALRCLALHESVLTQTP